MTGLEDIHDIMPHEVSILLSKTLNITHTYYARESWTHTHTHKTQAVALMSKYIMFKASKTFLAYLDGVSDIAGVVSDGELRVLQLELWGVVETVALVLPFKLQVQRIVISTRKTEQ